MSGATLEPGWHPPPEAPVLGSGEVHIWRAALDVPTARQEAYGSLLSGDERARAAALRDRAHFAVARGILRVLLSRYRHTGAHGLRFTYNQFDKPPLAGEAGGLGLLFNVAHSHVVALYP